MCTSQNQHVTSVKHSPDAEQTVWDELPFKDTTTRQARLSFRAVHPEGATLYS